MTDSQSTVRNPEALQPAGFFHARIMHIIIRARRLPRNSRGTKRMFRLRTFIFGALALFATAMLTSAPAAAFERHDSLVIATSDHAHSSFDLALPAAVLAEHVAIEQRSAETPNVDLVAAAPELGPTYHLSLITSARAIVDHPLRC